MQEVLFLDEPTNNLDPQTRLFLWERIADLHKRGVSIVLTTLGWILLVLCTTLMLSLWGGIRFFQRRVIS